MKRNISQFKNSQYDLLVIGGGINGAGIAHYAAQRGLRVALLEQHDFASGTSSKSTKLVHGGIRYLENLEFDLVYESLKERALQLKVAPHLVKPLAFVIPVYKTDKRPLWLVQFGVFLYDLIAGPYRVQKHKRLSVREIESMEPQVKKEGLLGGVLYYDAQMDDARLCLENVLSAQEHGAHAANYVKVSGLIKKDGKITGVKVHDMLDETDFEVYAKKIVCAVGPWTNGFLRLDESCAKKRVRTTKGIHIVYEGKISNHALLIMSKSDKRIFFVIPWMGNSMIGTTDTDYVGNPGSVVANDEDIDYLFSEAAKVFPGLRFDRTKIVNVFAGLRPLIRKGGSPNQVSRKHLFYETKSGLFFVVGGKYTTYRKISELCVNQITKLKSRYDFKLYGSGNIPENVDQVANEYGVSRDIVECLMKKYGIRYIDVLNLTKNAPGLKELINDNPPVIAAQIVYSIQTEMAQTAEDILDRRLSLQYYGKISDKCKSVIAEMVENIK